jgi:gluconolactonase
VISGEWRLAEIAFPEIISAYRMKRFFLTGSLLIASVLAVPRSAAAESRLLAPGARVEKLGGGYEFTEGPAANERGDIFFTDQPNDRIVRWDAQSGSFSDWLKPCGRLQRCRIP